MREYNDRYDRGRQGRPGAYYLPPRRRSVSREPELYTEYSDEYPGSGDGYYDDGGYADNGYDDGSYADNGYDDGSYADSGYYADNGAGHSRNDGRRPRGTVRPGGAGRPTGYRGPREPERRDAGRGNYRRERAPRRDGYYDGGYYGGRGRDDYGGQPKKSGRTGTVVLLLLVLLLFSAVGCAVFYILGLLGDIEYVVPEAVPERLLSVSSADILGSLPEDGMSGEELNAYHASVYRAAILGSYYSADELAASDSAVNILFISADEEMSVSDAIVLITIDTGSEKVTFTSLMPETGIAYAQADGPMRLSCAQLIGGPQLTVETVQSLLGIRIDAYLLLDSAGLDPIIERTGGITAQLSDEQLEKVNSLTEAGGGQLLAGGEQKLTGSQLTTLLRYAGASNGGLISSRRGELLFDIACNLNDTSVITLIKAFKEAAPHCSTSLEKGELFAMGTEMGSMRDYDVMTDTVPADSEYDLVTVNGRAIMRVRDIERCRRRIVIGAMGTDLPEPVEPASGTDAGEDVSGSDVVSVTDGPAADGVSVPAPAPGT